MTYNRKRPALDDCPVEAVLAIVSGKWKVRVLYLLSLDDLTFSEVRYSVGDVSQQVLSSVLKELIGNGAVRRSGTVSPRQIRYGLTAKGRELVALLMPLAEWGSKLLSQSGANWKPPEIQRRPQCEDRRLGAFPG
ncbi:helix-turn-helix domain-containing protein [Bradyrhizobium sp. JYMT SZCCT0428]|uniref:winged helix-turn-helix transcriptional regulator n=1 Tax=Bradyrhizobium sp. JYMT SZCCT0428 TaxID=2807673 RepID=UPI001BA4BC3F|nr:helix-turn-helix domain-containing protein [Bradyrhizobium sp. JYMT SZCCT0428]MBR1152382.1 helix-turn-helix transcriptional regulator [Bradyrhizobium sp. JYMT SZCCT0428]